MDIKTKFNVGDKVWYVAYDNIACDCPICEGYAYEEKPCGVRQGEVDCITLMFAKIYHEESYKIIDSRLENGTCIYTNRNSYRVYETKEQAEQAYADELAKYEEDLWTEKNRVAEWFAERYDGIKKPTASQ